MIRNALILVALLLASAAAAADRQEEMGGTVRLVLGPAQPGQSAVQGALVVDLAPGFKTYWKRPGDSGVPTQATFEGSDNLARASFLYPTPSLHSLPGDNTVSYKGEVVFPIQAERIDPSAPLVLRVKGMLGMCAEICIPVPLDLVATSSERLDPRAMPLLFAGTNRLPREGQDGIELTQIERNDEGLVTSVTIEGPKVRPRPTLFVASPEHADLVPYAAAKGDGPYRFELGEPARGPLEVVVSFGGTGARFDID